MKTWKNKRVNELEITMDNVKIRNDRTKVNQKHNMKKWTRSIYSWTYEEHIFSLYLWRLIQEKSKKLEQK